MNRYYIGWDVGGWRCDKNRASRDSIVILDDTRQLLGTPWRGNLTTTIERASSDKEFLDDVFQLCDLEAPDIASAIMAIDTPLGFPSSFVHLIARHIPLKDTKDKDDYLYRECERALMKQGHRPLSPIKDMIGSQATKGIHTLYKFTSKRVSTGVWHSGTITFIEAYPSLMRRSPGIQRLLASYPTFDHSDKNDALMCALTAWLFEQQPDKLQHPPRDNPAEEGWIWYPEDAFTAP